MIVTIASSVADFDRMAGWKITTQMLLKPDSVIGLSTGATTEGMHGVVADIYKRHPFDTSRVTLFGVDEFALVPRDFPGTCANDLHRQIVHPLQMPRENFVIPDFCAQDMPAECAKFETELMRRGGVDLQMLGIGQDGHMGMNLPGTPFDTDTRFTPLSGELETRIRRLNNYPAPAPLCGITLGIRTIMNIRCIVLVAKGSHKADIIRQALLGPITPQVPASVLQLHPNCTFLLDAEAGAQVRELATH